MVNKKEPDKSLIHVPNKEVGISDWHAPLNKNFVPIETNSWFDILHYENEFYKNNSFREVQVPIIPPDSIKQQKAAFRRRKINKEPVFLSTKKIRINPDVNQILILDSWFNAFAKMFNCTINYIRSVIYEKGKLIEINKAKELVNFYDIRKILLNQKSNIQKLTLPNKISIHILDEAINQAVSNYKTCITNYENGYIKKFRIREWGIDRCRKIIKIESGYFKNGTFCSRIFKSIESSEPLIGIDKTCTLQYNSDTKKYILLVPIGTKPEEKLLNPRIDCGIDLGVRTFASVYSEKGIHSICNRNYVGNYDKEFMNHLKKIDKINELLNQKEKESFVLTKKKVNGKLILDVKIKEINRQKLKEALKKYHRKIKNKVKDMHFKVAHELVNTYDNIFIGKLSTRKILSKNNKKINKRTRRMIGILSPYQFRQILIYMGYKYGSIVHEVSEYLTTKTCSCCGHLNEVGASKEYKCKYCKLEVDRDENSAKNHLKIGLKEIMFPKKISKKVTKLVPNKELEKT